MEHLDAYTKAFANNHGLPVDQYKIGRNVFVVSMHGAAFQAVRRDISSTQWEVLGTHESEVAARGSILRFLETLAAVCLVFILAACGAEEQRKEVAPSSLGVAGESDQVDDGSEAITDEVRDPESDPGARVLVEAEPTTTDAPELTGAPYRIVGFDVAGDALDCGDGWRMPSTIDAIRPIFDFVDADYHLPHEPPFEVWFWLDGNSTEDGMHPAAVLKPNGWQLSLMPVTEAHALICVKEGDA